MNDAEFATFFPEICARLGLRSQGYRRTGRSVRRRLSRRLRELGLEDIAAYRQYIEAHPGEWQWLDQSCRITISRFARDADVFEALVQRHLPALAASARRRAQPSLAIWSAGCASGEEPYALAIAWRLELQPRFPELELALLATDADPIVLARAARAEYRHGSLSELPTRWRVAFERRGDGWWLREPHRGSVQFQQADLRREVPDGPFDLVLCRNVVFTYFDALTQRRLAAAFAAALRPGGMLIVGRGERLPVDHGELSLCEPGFYVRGGGS